MSSRAYVRTLVLAAALGAPAAFAAVLFQTAVHDASQLVWEELPNGLGWSEAPWWYVLLVPALAGVIVAAAVRLPGRGGHAPLEGLGLGTIRPVDLVSILPAALATLSLGLVLGPEAPLIALGLAVGVVAARVARAEGGESELLVLAGAFAAVAALFGGPLPAAFLLFEVMAAGGKVPAREIGRVLLPGFAAAATGALVFTGVGDWPGLEPATLSLPGLPDYPTVRLVDVAWCALVAAVSAAVVVALRRGALLVAARVAARPAAALVTVGLLVGALAVAFRAAADRPVELVLFSGQAALPDIIAESSATVLVLLVVAKGLAYGLSLGVGFRGGPVFPALVLGAALGVLAELALPGLSVVPAIVAGVAASAAAVLRMPFFAVLVASLLAGPAAVDTAPIAILGAVIGWLVATAVPDRSSPSSSAGVD